MCESDDYACATPNTAKEPMPLVICDLGGVLVRLGSHASIVGFEDYIETVTKAQHASGHKNLRLELQNGRLTVDEYVAILRGVDDACSASHIRTLENGLLAGVYSERISYLHGLRRRGGVRWVVLSNTHRMHWDTISADTTVSALFDRAYLSYEIGAMKPDPAAFKQVLDCERTEVARCFFLDDIDTNVYGARALGIDAVRVDDTEAWRSALESWLERVAGPVLQQRSNDPARPKSRKPSFDRLDPIQGIKASTEIPPQ